jgi:predicted AlkP superfamily phosphohydrolase/phosphomutase
MKPVKVLLVGWDGAEPDLVEPWVEQGKLPVLASLVKRGTLGRIRSTVPAVTPPAWSSIMTGLQPGRHGIYAFTRPGTESSTEIIVTAAERQGTSVWRYLSEAGRQVGVFNLSLTYPPEPVSGFLLAGFDAPVFNASITHPAEAFGVALRNINGYSHWMMDAFGDSPHEDLQRQLFQQRDVLFNLTREYSVEVLAVNFNSVDHIHHKAWPIGMDGQELAQQNGTVVERMYRDMDAVLGDLLAEYADQSTHVIVLSDHGGGRMKGQMSMARALEAGGFLVLRRQHKASLLLGLRRALWLTLPHSVRSRIWGMAGARFRLDMHRRVQQATLSDVDWEQTKAFPWGDGGFVQINQRGREPQGSVAPEDTERVLADIEAYMRTIRDPHTGELVVGETLRGAEVYGESPAGYPPDLLVESGGMEYNLLPWWDGPEDLVLNLEGEGEKPERQGNHRPWGMLATCGPAVQPGATVPKMQMVDITPALLYLAGVPVPEGLDGQVRRELWDTGQEAGTQDAVTFEAPAAAPYTEEEQAAVEQRLADLGYM